MALGVFFFIREGFDGLCRWVEWDEVAFFPIRVGFDGLRRWVEWD